MQKLTKKQQRFCEEYLVDLNATQAAIRAGYKEKSAPEVGCENLRKPYLKAVIDAELEKRREKTKGDAEWIRKQLIKLTERCMQEVQVFNKKGEPTGEFKFDSSGANKAMDTLNRMYGNYEIDNSQKATTVQVQYYAPEKNKGK